MLLYTKKIIPLLITDTVSDKSIENNGKNRYGGNGLNGGT